jgi:hypothetical protein
MAFEAGLGAAFGLPAISQATVLSGILAVLVDIDHVELPPHRTPAGHSLPAAAFWVYISVAAAALLFPAWTASAALASISAFSTHLALDHLTKEGIFLWPAGLSVREWFHPLPRQLLLDHGGRYFLSSDEKDHQALADGKLAWPGWRRGHLELPALPVLERLPGDVVISSLGLLGLVVAAALS